MKKRRLYSVPLSLLFVCSFLMACSSTPENLNTYYDPDESKGGNIVLWIKDPNATGDDTNNSDTIFLSESVSSRVNMGGEEWIGEYVHNHLTETFKDFSPVTIVNRSDDSAYQELKRSEGLEFEEDSEVELGGMKVASHILTFEISHTEKTKKGDVYSVKMTMTQTETNTALAALHSTFIVKEKDGGVLAKMTEKINDMCYEILETIEVKLTPVGKQLLKKVDKDTLEASEALAKAEYEREKERKKQEKQIAKAEKQSEEAGERIREMELKSQKAALKRQEAELKAEERALKREESKRAQRKQQLNIAFTIGQDFYGVDAQIHFTGVNHWFLGIEGGVLAGKEKFKHIGEILTASESKDQTSSSLSNATTTTELKIQDIIKYNVVGVTGVNFSLFNKILAPYAKIGAGYLSDSKNSGFGLLGGMGLYCTIPDTPIVIFFDYTANYLWERYFFDKYTVGIGLDFSNIIY